MPNEYDLDAAWPVDEAPTTDCVGSITSEPASIAGNVETGSKP